MTNLYPESQSHSSHEEKLSELLRSFALAREARAVARREEELSKLIGRINDGFIPGQYIHIDSPDEPNLDSLKKQSMSFYKDGSDKLDDNYVGCPDSSLVSELLTRGLVAWHIKPHPSNRSYKVRYYELAE